eukprot:6678246-Pyramimonas_sp.AAC.1
MVGPSGELHATACGAVPVHCAAPAQQARDGEDYASFKLAGLVEGGFQVWTDCEGALGCVWGRWPSVSSGSPRAHLWSRVWRAFEDGPIARRTLGHASFNDIVEGCSAHFEMQGSKHADRFAKLGAALHPSVGSAKPRSDELKSWTDSAGFPAELGSDELEGFGSPRRKPLMRVPGSVRSRLARNLIV